MDKSLEQFFTKIKGGEGVPGPYRDPHAKFHRCHSQNVGLQPPKSPTLVIFGIYLPQTVYPFKQFLQNLVRGTVGGSSSSPQSC